MSIINWNTFYSANTINSPSESFIWSETKENGRCGTKLFSNVVYYIYTIIFVHIHPTFTGSIAID